MRLRSSSLVISSTTTGRKWPSCSLEYEHPPRKKMSGAHMRELKTRREISDWLTRQLNGHPGCGETKVTVKIRTRRARRGGLQLVPRFEHQLRPRRQPSRAPAP